jgi:hypothetical protein
MSLSH